MTDSPSSLVLLGALTFLLTVALVLSLGCGRFYAPREVVATLPGPAPLVHQRAVQTFAQMGGTITHHDMAQGILIGTVKNAVQLYVRVLPLDAQQTRVEVAGSVLPGQAVLGSLTEPDEFLTALRGRL